MRGSSENSLLDFGAPASNSGDESLFRIFGFDDVAAVTAVVVVVVGVIVGVSEVDLLLVGPVQDEVVGQRS